MKKYIAVLTLALMLGAASVAFAASKGGFQDPAATAATGGFSGPGVPTTTVEQAKTLRDKARVALKGNLVQQLGNDTYLFKDATGTVNVDIDHDKWEGQTISPADTIEIQGKVDKDWNSVEIDVKRIRKVQ